MQRGRSAGMHWHALAVAGHGQWHAWLQKGKRQGASRSLLARAAEATWAQWRVHARRGGFSDRWGDEEGGGAPSEETGMVACRVRGRGLCALSYTASAQAASPSGRPTTPAGHEPWPEGGSTVAAHSDGGQEG